MQKRLSVDVALNNFEGLKHQMIQISTLKSANQSKIRQGGAVADPPGLSGYCLLLIS